jgi:hypothetical protein
MGAACAKKLLQVSECLTVKFLITADITGGYRNIRYTHHAPMNDPCIGGGASMAVSNLAAGAIIGKLVEHMWFSFFNDSHKESAITC